MTPVLWEDDEPDQRGRIPGTARHVKRMAASGKTSVERIRVCCWCHRGPTASDDVLLQLESEAVITHGLHEECAPKWEEAATNPDSERW